jgi:hypothetical protein
LLWLFSAYFRLSYSCNRANSICFSLLLNGLTTIRSVRCSKSTLIWSSLVRNSITSSALSNHSANCPCSCKSLS